MTNKNEIAWADISNLETVELAHRPADMEARIDEMQRLHANNKNWI
jgi:hypothetical protein